MAQIDSSSPKMTAEKSSWWERHMVPRLISKACSQGQIMKARSQIIPLARGDILELGCGGGLNMDFYDWTNIKSFTGLDPSPQLLQMSEAALEAIDSSVRKTSTSIQLGRGEAMPFADQSFDMMIATFTLCSVQEPLKVLAEAHRILRDQGSILFLEHGAAPDEKPAQWQRRIEPVWKRMAGNCHLTRPISRAYEASGFLVEKLGAYYMPNTPKAFGWVEYGIARKRP